MICKDSVLTWFKGLNSHSRIDLMCSLLNKCLPFELRFLGTCLENLGRQDFSQMKDFEVKANNAQDLSDFHTQSCIISDTKTRQKLAVYVCLLHSLNTACSTIIFKCLYGIDINEVVAKARNSAEEKILEDLLTIYTVAVNHPAFTFEQRSNLGSILLRLTKEENRLQSEKLADSVNADYTQAQLDGLETPRTDLPQPPAPPGLSYPPGSFIQLPPFYFIEQHQLPNQPVVLHMNNPPMVGEGGAYVSPHISSHSSPSQSTQHSRNSSPVRKQYQTKLRPLFSEPPPPAYLERVDQAAKGSPVHPDVSVRNLNERLIGLTTDEMLRGATVVSMNGMPPARVAPPKPRLPYENDLPPPTNQRLQYENDMPPPTNQRLPFENEMPPPTSQRLPHENEMQPPTNQRLPFDQDGPPPGNQRLPYDAEGSLPTYNVSGPRTPLLHTRYSQQSLVKENSHLLEENRNCSSSSSGSDASSTSHSPPTTPATLHRTWDNNRYDNDDIKTRGVSYGRGRIGIQTLPRERLPMVTTGRRDGPRSAPPTPHEENKTYVVPPPLSDLGPARGDMIANMPYTGPFIHGPFATAPPVYPPYPQAFVRPPYSFPNGEVLYTYHPSPATPFPQSPLMTYTSSVPPPKIACYNCSSHTHQPNDCKEPTMEEYCSKGQYRIDYGKSGELLDK